MGLDRLDSDQAAKPSEAPWQEGSPVSLARRRLFRGAGAGAGVLLAVSAKSALGGTVCKSPSALMSGNTSPRPGNGTSCSGGRSPGFWCQPLHAPEWTTAGGVFPQFNGQVVTCTTGTQVTFADITNQGTTLQSVFTGWNPIGYAGSVSMWWAIKSPNDAMFGGSSGIGQLLRHLSAAWLNAGYFNTSSAYYPLTKAQVVDMWVQLNTKGTYCPGSLKCTTPWTKTDVINYLTSMYDINAPVDNVCKK